MSTTTAPGIADLPEPSAPPTAERPRSSGRLRMWIVLGAIAALALLGVVVYAIATRGKESTDDAQAQADVVPVAPRVGGAVLRVLVQENGHVKQGDVLLAIDDADYRVKAQQAEAELAAARAAVARAGPEAGEAAIELDRTRRLVAQGAAPKQQLDKAEASASSSRAALLQAQANLAAAEAAVALARLQLGYTTVVAPGDGTISDLTARVGQILPPDQPFAQFVPDRTYVVANFKETQTGAMRPGQRASISIDAYPHRSLEGRVESLSAATGAQFSLLPPNNATGNFVKVVQRVPVRIALVDPPKDIVLRAGLSATVTVYVR